MSTYEINIKDTLAREINKQILESLIHNPESRLLNLEDVTHEVIKDYLQSLPYTTWSIYSTRDRVSLEKATKWFENQMSAFYEFVYGRVEAVQDRVS